MTFQWVPDVRAWTFRKKREVNYHLIQFLKGHDCFRDYIHRFKLSNSNIYPICGSIQDSDMHTIFIYDALEHWQRDALSISVNVPSTDNIIALMLQSKED